MTWRWWWLPVKELVKLTIVITATGSAMRAPHIQALLVLLLIVLAGFVAWNAQAGCSTSMERMQFAGYCWLQLLALLLLVLLLLGVRVGVAGGVVLALVLLVMGQCWVVIGGLVVRCIAAAGELAQAGRGGGR
jgi:hypothetical protein